MTDISVARLSDTLAHPKPMTDGSGAHMAEQVRIEAERLGGTVEDGVEAAKAASKTYGSLYLDTYARVIRSAMRNSAEMSDHVVALMQARTMSDVFRLNVAFMQRQVSSTQERLFEVWGVKDPVAGREERSARATSGPPSEPAPIRTQDRERYVGDGRDARIIRA